MNDVLKIRVQERLRDVLKVRVVEEVSVVLKISVQVGGECAVRNVER